MLASTNFTNRHGERLDISHHPAANDGCLVLLGHGVTGNKDRPLLVAIASGLAARGWPCLRFSFAGNGDSDGDFRAATISKECDDLRDLVAQLPESLRIAYVGHSMGGAVGVRTAVVEPRLQVLVSLAGMVRTAAFCEREFGAVTPGEGHMWDEPDCPLSQVFVDDLTGIGDLFDEIAKLNQPLLLIHGTADDVVFPDDSIDAHIQAPAPKELVLIDGAGHSFDDATYPQVIAAIDRWLRQHLG